MTRLDAQEDRDKFLALFRVILRSTLVASILFITIFHFYRRSIYHFWLRKTVPFEQPVMDLFLIYMAQFIFWLTCSHPLQATNRHHTLAKVLFIASILTIGLAYWGGRHLGLPGIALGMIIGDLILPFWFVPYLLRDYQGYFSWKFFVWEMAPFAGSLVILATVPILRRWFFSCSRMVAAVGAGADPGADSVATSQKVGAFMRRRFGKGPYGDPGAGVAGQPGKP